jgi:excisionase family DNA binding protein
MTRLLTIEQFAEATGWKPRTVRNKIERRELDYVRIGRSVRIKAETLEQIIERGTIPALESATGGVQ